MKKSILLICFTAFVLHAQGRYDGRILEHGMKGQRIKKLQYDLYFLGYAVYLAEYGGATGEFNQATTNAVIALQRDRGLVQHGIVDSKTTAAIDQMLASTEMGSNYACFNPMRYEGRRMGLGNEDEAGKSVSRLQDDLRKLGYSISDPRGKFLTETQKALRAFQEDALIPQSGQTDEHTTVQLAYRLCVSDKK